MNVEKDIQAIYFSIFVYIAGYIISFCLFPIEPLFLFACACFQNGFMYLMLPQITQWKELAPHRLTFQCPYAAYSVTLIKKVKIQGIHQIKVSTYSFTTVANQEWMKQSTNLTCTVATACVCLCH